MARRQFPRLGKQNYNCPHCDVLTEQSEIFLYKSATEKYDKDNVKPIEYSEFEPLTVKKCNNCSQYTIWLGEQYIYPRRKNTPIPEPADGMPKKVLQDYKEAARVVDSSPRAAAALLRLAIERLMDHLDVEGGLNACIGKLVEEERIPRCTQKALDVVRVVGNYAVHPEEMDIAENKETVVQLFEIVNDIVREVIRTNGLRNDIYRSLPENKKKGIERRDGK